MNKIIVAAIGIAMFAMSALTGVCADVMYTETPDDTSAITVSDGTTTMVGVDAFRHLKHYWAFDNASDLAAASVGGTSLKIENDGGIAATATNDVKRGGSAVYFANKVAYKVDPIPTFITPTVTDPFTVSFWLKGGRRGRQSSRIFYYGARGKQESVGTFLDLMYQNTANLRQFYWFGGPLGSSFVLSEDNTPVDRWVHVAISCNPNGTWQADGSVANVAVTLYFDGENRGTRVGVLNTGDSPVLLLGTGYGASSANPTFVSDTIFDEFMIFNKALSEDEVAWIAENTRPFEFSAGWDIGGSGTLDIAGIESQTVRGTGVVTTDEGLTLAPATSTFFGGTVAGASLTLNAQSSVTQTLASAVSYTGATVVASGTLALDPARAMPTLENTLIAYYSCDDPDNPGRDDTGNGNDLSRANSNAYVEHENSVAGGALHFPATGDEVNGYSSSGRLSGFSSTEDNSFIVSLWVRMEEWQSKLGFFNFGMTHGLRLNTTNHHLYHGDNGALVQFNYWQNVADGKWWHYVLVYDSNPAEGGRRYRLFVNGALVSESDSYKTTIKHAADSFCLGRGMASDGAWFKGDIDEVFVLKGANTNDVAALYNYRRTEFEAANAAPILPSETTVTVDAGATLFITNSCESVKELRGGGTVYISSGSSLRVRKCKDFRGNVVGGGVFSHPGMVLVFR